VSPLTLRRYRAERLLRAEFENLRTRVLGTVRGRLLASGVVLDQSDLEACYGQAFRSDVNNARWAASVGITW
jgi:hypothetical protein